MVSFLIFVFHNDTNLFYFNFMIEKYFYKLKIFFFTVKKFEETFFFVGVFKNNFKTCILVETIKKHL